MHNLADGYPVRLVRVEDSSRHLAVANRFYRVGGKPPIPALQVVFPDENGRWPWQDEYALDTQPLVGPVPADGDGVEYWLQPPGQ